MAEQKRQNQKGKGGKAPKPSQPAKASQRDRFLDRVAQDLPSRSLSKSIDAPINSMPSSLQLLNRVGLISAFQLKRELRSYCNVTSFASRNEWNSVNWQSLDALIVEGRIMQRANPWRRSILNIDQEGQALYRILSRARAHNVPTVLWITEENSAIDKFYHLFDKVDLVVAPLGSNLKGSNIIEMGPCVDVKTFNPLVDNQYQRRNLAPLFSHLVDGSHEIGMVYGPDKAGDFFEPLFDYNWWLTDSSVDVRNNNHKIPAVMRRRFIGTKKDKQLATLMRYAQVYFMPRAMTEHRPRHAQQRFLQASATKTCVFTDDPTLNLPHTALADTKEGLRDLCNWVTDDPIGKTAVQHLAWRDAVTNHTYFEGLETIFKQISIRPRYNAPRDPSVNVVVPTIRPSLIPFIMKTIDQQEYKNIHLTIVVNGVDVPPEIKRLVDASPHTQMVTMPNDKSIGYCMNYGVDLVESDYWAKFDDDDLYGPHFLSDMLLQNKYLDFDITGKGAIFTYFEDGDRMNVRRLDNHDAPEVYIGGGTILARNGSAFFPEDVRGFADTLFLLNATESGQRIVAADPFNFVQVRRADPTSHTWTAGAHQLNLKGPQRVGKNFDGVII